MEALDDDGKGRDAVLEHRQQEQIREALDRADELELGDLVDEVDVIKPLDAVEIALVDGVDAQEARLAVGAGLAALADLDRVGPGLGEGAAQVLVTRSAPQVVEVAVGDAGQALVTRVAEPVPGALAELAGGRSRQGVMEAVDFGQQRTSSAV